MLEKLAKVGTVSLSSIFQPLDSPCHCMYGARLHGRDENRVGFAQKCKIQIHKYTNIQIQVSKYTNRSTEIQIQAQKYTSTVLTKTDFAEKVFVNAEYTTLDG